jgi:hypothetical protein
MGMAISAPRYTIDDVDQLPDDGNRYEVLDGMLLGPRPGYWLTLSLDPEQRGSHRLQVLEPPAPPSPALEALRSRRRD